MDRDAFTLVCLRRLPAARGQRARSIGLPGRACYFAAVKRTLLIAFLSALLPAGAQDDNVVTLDDVVQTAQDFARDNNLDEEVLRSLPNLDQQKVRDFLALIQKEFRRDYVVDLAQLKDSARLMLPLLESREDTQPYALWLKSRLDYLDAADDWQRNSPPPKAEPGKPPPPVPNPKPQQERDLWIKTLSKRPAPKEAPPLVAELKPIFAQEKIPSELVWVAEVESSFNARARSPAGAAGLFQLMPATAKRFGLRTWPLDQRFDSQDSARAAAKYLRTLHGRFKDWRLALAAYNSGEGTVQKLLDRHKAKSFDAIATHLPAETQMYVPKVEAVILRREGVKFEELAAPGV